MSTRPAPPWYKQFAASEISNPRFYELSAAERGLLHSMRLASWVEGRVPGDPVLVARQTRLPESDVTHERLQKVLTFFVQDPDSTDGFFDPCLREQWEAVVVSRKKMSVGGKKGATRTNSRRERRANPAADGVTAEGYPARVSRGPSSPSPSPSPSTSPSSIGEADSSQKDQWVKDYEKVELA